MTSTAAGCRILSELSIKRNGARAWSSFLWIEQSPKAGGVPPLEMYTHILGILGKCGREWVGRAVFILDRMDRRRMRLDKVAFNAALNILGERCQRWRHEECRRVLVVQAPAYTT